MWQLQSAWQGPKCEGPPNTMTIFNSSLKVSPEWKSAGLKRTGMCGILLHSPLQSGCCQSSIRPQKDGMCTHLSIVLACYFCSISNSSSRSQESGTINKGLGMGSFTSTSVETVEQSEMLMVANGALYCHLIAKTVDSLFGMHEYFFLASSNNCIYSKIKCIENGTLVIYPDDHCSGPPTTFSLAENNSTLINNSYFGEVTAGLKTIIGGSTNVVWTTYYPAYLNVPDPSHFSYYIAIIFYGMAVCGTIKVGLLYTYRFYKGKTVFMLGYMLSQLFWLIWIVLDAYGIFAVIEDFQDAHILNTARDYLLGICTLVSVFITGNILLLLTQKKTTRNQALASSFLLLLHLTLSGSLYLYPFLPKSDWATAWKRMIPAWVLFFYFFDLSPPIYIFLKSYQLTPQRKTESFALFKTYARFLGILLALQAVNAFWYIAMFYVANFTIILGNDRYLLAMDGVYAFSYVFHSMVACILNHHMRKMLNLAAKLQQESLFSSSTLSSDTTDRISYFSEDFLDEKPPSFTTSQVDHSGLSHEIGGKSMDSQTTVQDLSEIPPIHHAEGPESYDSAIYQNARDSLSLNRTKPVFSRPPSAHISRRGRRYQRQGAEQPIIANNNTSGDHRSLSPSPSIPWIPRSRPESESTYSQLFNATTQIERASSPFNNDL